MKRIKGIGKQRQLKRRSLWRAFNKQWPTQDKDYEGPTRAQRRQLFLYGEKK